jgi:hypothetical protein
VQEPFCIKIEPQNEECLNLMDIESENEDYYERSRSNRTRSPTLTKHCRTQLPTIKQETPARSNTARPSFNNVKKTPPPQTNSYKATSKTRKQSSFSRLRKLRRSSSSFLKPRRPLSSSYSEGPSVRSKTSQPNFNNVKTAHTNSNKAISQNRILSSLSYSKLRRSLSSSSKPQRLSPTSKSASSKQLKSSKSSKQTTVPSKWKSLKPSLRLRKKTKSPAPTFKDFVATSETSHPIITQTIVDNELSVIKIEPQYEICVNSDSESENEEGLRRSKRIWANEKKRIEDIAVQVASQSVAVKCELVDDNLLHVKLGI